MQRRRFVRRQLLNGINFPIEIIGFGIGPMTFVPLPALPAMVFSLTFRVTTGFLPTLLTHIRLKPLSAYVAGALPP